MAHYAVTAYDVATGAVVDTFKTMLSMISANTDGHRGELQFFSVCGAGGDPQDIQVTCRINRTNNATAGTSTAVTPTSLDPDSLATVITSGKNYSVEPTTYESSFALEAAFNARAGFTWSAPRGMGIKWKKNQTLAILCTPGTATATTLNLTAHFEQY
jgi:hypothetical protein